MYEWIDELYGNDGAGLQLRSARVDRSRASLHRARAEMRIPGKAAGEQEEAGGPIAWQYLTPRVRKLWENGEISTNEMKASLQFCYLYRMQWILHAPGTNMIKGEKVQGGRIGLHQHRVGKAFPIHELLKLEHDVLEAALIREVGFKDLPASIGESRITRHRTGKQAFISALGAFDRINRTLLTK